MAADFSGVRRSYALTDERGRSMTFPSRQDYVDHLVDGGLIRNARDLTRNAPLNEAIYLDWLKRGQVGCVFAQLLGRPTNRGHMRTEILTTEPPYDEDIHTLASDIDDVIHEAIAAPAIESVSVLLPAVLDVEKLALLVHALSKLPQWVIDHETRWRDNFTLIGLRRAIDTKVLAEPLVIGPFEFLPQTRHSPVTSLEIRTDPFRAPRSKYVRSMQAGHLAAIDTSGFLTPAEHAIRFEKWTPALRRRMLGCEDDSRAKAASSVTLPTVIWEAVKRQEQD